MKKHFFILIIFFCSDAFAQQITLNDLSSFQTPKANWSIAGNVSADFNQNNTLQTQAGTGILVCQHEEGKYGIEYDLQTKLTHGDADIELDFMMTKGANSGIYLQGRYEIQLFDSWGKKNVSSADCGGIYERWNESKPTGQKGYEGYAPRQNACKAPGLWQHIKIAFQAPKFDIGGKKIANARIISIVLNGVLIHEDVELTGQTRSAIEDNEVSTAPLRFQGDHGSIAFRNINIKNYDKPNPKLSKLSYEFYNLRSPEAAPDLSKHKPDFTGETNELTARLAKTENDFVMRFVGKIDVPVSGEYTISATHVCGNGRLFIAGKEVLPWTWWSQKRNVQLNAGLQDFELIYSKTANWGKPQLGLSMEAVGVRKTDLHTLGSMVLADPINPIFIKVGNEPILHRSFLDVKNPLDTASHRITHAISVGNPAGIHYSYNLKNGALVQIWKGGFLDATPMWNDRGDGSAKPLGASIILGDFAALSVLSDANAIWKNEEITPKGYSIDEDGNPTYKMMKGESTITAKINVEENGKYLSHEIAANNAPNNLYARLASGTKIEALTDGFYAINDKAYFIKTSEKAIIRTINGQQELIILLKDKVKYAIIF